MVSVSFATSTTALSPTDCTHCKTPLRKGDPHPFCCLGCKAVFFLLKDRGLEDYYRLREASGSPLIPGRDFLGNQINDFEFFFLDDSEFLNQYAPPSSDPSNTQRTMQFFLEGVHCAACVWLTEKIPLLVDGVHSARLNLGTSVATITISAEGRFSQVAQELARMGYRPHPIREGADRSLRLQEDRKLLVRVAVAGACSGNIMLLAIATYAGASGTLAEIFRWVTFGLFLPVLFWSSSSFFKNAWNSFRAGQLSIDIPIAFGLAMGSAISTYNLVHQRDQIYFDSLAAVVFLLLSTRYILRKAQGSTLSSYELLYHLTPSFSLRRSPQEEEFQEVRTDQVRMGDRVQVRVGQTVPLDGKVTLGESTLNLALLTGESTPIEIKPGDLVFAGTINLRAPIELIVTQSGSESRLGRILKSVESHLSEKAPIVTFTDRVSQGFVAVTFLLAFVAFFTGWSLGIHEALNRFLAIVIVMCPCSFALATPLALSSAIQRAARGGILIKTATSIEKLARIQKVYFDKTGTLTEGKLRVQSWFTPDSPIPKNSGHSIEIPPSTKTAEIIVALEAKSNHPIAKALVQHFEPLCQPTLPRLENFEEKLGFGVRANYQGKQYEIRQDETQFTTAVSLYEDGIKKFTVLLADAVREDSRGAIEELRKLGVEIGLLSGDSEGPALLAGKECGISEREIRFKLSPEQKAEVLAMGVANGQFAMMVGDGANDAQALASSYLGIAVQGGVEVSMKAADVFCTAPGIQPISKLIVLGRETVKVIHRNFFFSILYNAFGVFAALKGWVNPLFAAILMPMSAFTVFASALYGTGKMRIIFNNNINHALPKKWKPL